MTYNVKSVTSNQYKVSVVNQNGSLLQAPATVPTVTGQTITVTNNWGTATDDPTIATAKGWTVTG